MHGRIKLGILTSAAFFLAACGSVEIRNPFDRTPTPLEASLAATQLAIDGATEWYVSACVVKELPASDATCDTYRDDVDPAVREAHNRAIDVATGSDGTPLGIAIASTDAARATLDEFVVRYDQGGKTWAQALRLALAVLSQRLAEVR